MTQVYTTRTRDDASEVPWTEAQRNAIHTEAELILANPSFKKSRRCVVLFRRLIEYAMEGGDENGIKERTLGIEVFGREADYDTNTDPIVRMTANEIRKRLAQYYQSSTGDHEVHIDLIPGSYLPRFEFRSSAVSLLVGSERQPDSTVTSGSDLDSSIPYPTNVVPDAARVSDSRRRSLIILSALLLGCLIAAGILVAFRRTEWAGTFRSNQYLLWAPLLDSSTPVTVCLADVTPTEMRSNDWAQRISDLIAGKSPQKWVNEEEKPYVSFVDSEVAVRTASWLQTHGKQFKIARSSVTTLDNFRQGPVVLIGAFNNTWNLVLLSNLRYHVQIDPITKEEWIEDQQNPSKHDWKGSGKLLYSDSSTDFAIITRIFDRDTGNWILSAGGLGMHGTEVAGELLTAPELSQSLPSVVRSGRQNFQIVLKTTVIGGHAGTPQILAVHSW
jgi:hypothetical protein